MAWWTVVQVILAVISVASAIMARKNMRQKDRAGITVNRFGTDKPFPVVTGRRETGPDIVYQTVRDDFSKKPVNEIYYCAGVISVGEIEQVHNIRFDDKLISEFGFSSDPAGEGDLSFKADDSEQKITIFYGRDQRNVPSWFEDDVAGISGSWDDIEFRGLAVIFCKLVMDNEFKRYPQGLPEIKIDHSGKIIENLLTGATDKTVPRLPDVLWWYMQDQQVGKRVDGLELYKQSFIDMAQYIEDNPATLPDGGTRPLKTCNTIINTEDKINDTIEALLDDQDAKLIESDVGVRFDFLRERTPDDFTITDADIIGGMKAANVSMNDRYNQVIVRFPDEDNRYEINEAVFPNTGSDLHNTWLTEDNNVENQLEEEVDSITNYYEAMQKAEMLARASRDSINLDVTIGARGWMLEEMDVIKVDSAIRGWDGKPFRVDEITYQSDGVKLKLVEYQPSIYPWSNKDPKDDYEDTNLDDPFLLDPVSNLSFNLTREDMVHTGTISWDEPDGYVRFYRVKVTNSNGDELYLERVYDTQWKLPKVETGDYRVDVWALNDTTESDNTFLEFFVPVEETPLPDDLTIVNLPGSIRVTPPPLQNKSDTYEWVYGLSPDRTNFTNSDGGQSDSFLLTNPLDGRTYYFFYRSVTAEGFGEWNSVSAVGEGLGELNTNPGIQEVIDRAGPGGEIDNQLETITYDLERTAISVEDSSLAVLRSLSQQSASREELRSRLEDDELLIDAAVYVDPTSGTIVNRAFQYTDEQFTQAQLEIDGVNAQINATVERVTLVEGQVTDLSAELDLVPGQITATANAVVADAISALEPAHSFNFFDSAQEWVAVNGTLSATTANQIDLTLGDIENDSLNFVADDNPLIRITVERTSGTGWVGDLIIERDDATTETYSGIIEDIAAGGEIVRSIDLRGISSYNGTINRVRLILGDTTADEFTVKSIVIGKPDAALLELEDVSARVTQAELDIDANEATISQTVTDLQLFEDDTADQFTQVSSEIDAANASITDSIFQVAGNRRDFEDEALQELMNEIDNANYRAGDLDVRLSYAEAINQLQVDVGQDGALAQSITGLEAVTVANGSAIQANTAFIQQVETKADGTAFALNALQNTVDDPESGLSATNQLAQQAQIDAEDNASTITTIAAGVTGESDEATALVRLDSYFSEGGLGARAFFGTDVNGRVTGIVVNDSGSEQVISFQASVVEFLDQNGDAQVYWDATASRYVFNGEIVADAGTFNGTVTSQDGNIAGWSITVDSLTSGDTSLNATTETLTLGSEVSISPTQVSLGSGFTWSALTGLNVDGNAQIAGWNITTDSLTSGDTSLNSATETLTLGSGVSINKDVVNFGTGFTWDSSLGLMITGDAEIAGWDITTGLLRSAESGARVELNADKNRVSVFDATNEKVVMGYLNNLPKYDQSGNWSANDYGFWVRRGDNLVIDGDVEYNNGDWLIENDASLKITDGTTGNQLLRVGTDNGAKGLFLYDGTNFQHKLGEFSTDRIKLGSRDDYFSYENGTLEISGTLTAADGKFSGDVEFIGEDNVRVISGSPFGPDGLIEWFGSLSDVNVTREYSYQVYELLSTTPNISTTVNYDDNGAIVTTSDSVWFQKIPENRRLDMSVDKRLLTGADDGTDITVTVTGSGHTDGTVPTAYLDDSGLTAIPLTDQGDGVFTGTIPVNTVKPEVEAQIRVDWDGYQTRVKVFYLTGSGLQLAPSKDWINVPTRSDGTYVDDFIDSPITYTVYNGESNVTNNSTITLDDDTDIDGKFRAVITPDVAAMTIANSKFAISEQTGDAYFNGQINGGSIDIGSGTFTVDSSGNMVAQSATIEGRGTFDNGLSADYNDTRLSIGGIGITGEGALLEYRDTTSSPAITSQLRMDNSGVTLASSQESGGSQGILTLWGKDETRIGNTNDNGVVFYTNRLKSYLGVGMTLDFDTTINADLTVTGTITNFTGSHPVNAPESRPEYGDLVCERDVTIQDVNNAIGDYKACDEPMSKLVAGIYASDRDDQMLVNAVGEGTINVCGMNGDIQQGDLLTSSVITGKAQRQDDDIVRSYTVAKARQSVTFNSPDEVKRVACFYYCG